MAVGDLFIRQHEVEVRMILKYRRVAVIPLAVKLNEVPVVAVLYDRVSLDHEVRDPGAVEEHFRAREINVAVACLLRKAHVCGFLISRVAVNSLIVNVRVDPVEDRTGRIDIVVALELREDIIRNIVMPLFKERINSASEEHIVQLAYRTAQVEEFARKAADEAMAEMEADGRISATGKNKSGGGSFGYRINAVALREKGGLLTNMIIRNLMGRLAGGLKDIGSVHIEDAAALLDKQTGRKIDLPYGIEARREYDDLVLEKDAGTVKGGFSFRIGKDELEELSETSPMIVELPADNASGFVKLKLYLTEPPTDRDFSKNLYTEYFDCDKIKNGVEIRTRREGDRLLIKRGGGSAGLAGKSLKSWMIDNKIPLRERDSILLAADSEHILWIMGRRRDDSCFIDGNTTKVLVMILE